MVWKMGGRRGKRGGHSWAGHEVVARAGLGISDRRCPFRVGLGLVGPGWQGWGSQGPGGRAPGLPSGGPGKGLSASPPGSSGGVSTEQGVASWPGAGVLGMGAWPGGVAWQWAV